MSKAPHTVRDAARHPGILLAVLLVATFMGQFDFFVVNVAAPPIQVSLSASDAELELVVGGYAFAYASGLIVGGRLGDLYGHRRMYCLGLVLFAITSVLCGIAPTAVWLLISRALQGLAGAVMIPQVLAVINTVIPGGRRGWAMAWFGAAAGAGSIGGQVLGGWFVDADLFGLGWRAIFLINAPIAAVTLIAAFLIVPSARRPHAPNPDLPAAGGLALGLALVLLPFVLGRQHGWPQWSWVLAACGLGLLCLVLRIENRLAARGREPIIDTALLGLPSLARGSMASVAFMFYFASFMFRLTILLQQGENLSPLQAGLVFAPSGIAFVLSSLLMRGSVARSQSRAIGSGAIITAIGLALALCGLIIEPFPTLPLIIAAVSVTGFGNGFVLPALIGYALSDVPPARAGVGSGIVTAAQQFAASAGVAILGTIYFALSDVAGHRHAMAWTLPIDLILIGWVAMLVGQPRRNAAAFANGNDAQR